MSNKDNKDNDKVFNDIEPLFAETPTVKINGKEYKMRRLGIRDTFKLAKIISIGAAGMGAEIGNIELNPEMVAGLLLAGFPFAEDEILKLLANIIGVTFEDIKDPVKFPMGSEIEIIRGLMKHIDVKVFFTKAAELLKAPEAKEFLKNISTSSKEDTKSLMKK